MKILLKKIWHVILRVCVALLPESDRKRRWSYFLRFGWKFHDSGYSVSFSGREISICGGGLKISGRSANILWSACGILCDREYDFADRDKYIMIDIGMNAAIASLWFAKKENIVHVYGFEPFARTFAAASANIEANPSCRGKITAFNCGLGECDRKLSVRYNGDFPGSMSTVRDVFPDGKAGTPEEVSVRSASSVLRTIFSEHQGVKKFLKVDCEGAETEILRDLAASGMLRSEVDLIFLEWHFGNVDEVLHILCDNGFVAACRHTVPGRQGTITAYSKNYSRRTGAER